MIKQLKTKLGLIEEPKHEMKMERILTQNARVNAGNREMSRAEREKIANYIKGMNQEELKIVMDNVPIELCHNKIGEELKNFKKMKTRQKEMASMLEADS